MQLLIRSDDLGYSEAVNYGIEKALRFGLTRSVGLMTNMSAASHGVALVKDLPICIGQHTNICVGRPVADPRLIPSLVDAGGRFKSSREYRSASEDPVVLDEAIIEVEAQYRKFKELVGREPGYFDCHAIRSNNFIEAVSIVAQRHGLKLSGTAIPGELMQIGTSQGYRSAVGSMLPDYDAVQSLREAIKSADENRPNVYVCHPGYVDYELLCSSSLTLNRTRETAMLTDPEVGRWLDEQGVELVSYDDVGN